jgi:hypothetical protein
VIVLPLLRVQLLHVYRNRLIVFGILAGILLELGGLSLLRNITVSFQSVVSPIGWQQSLFVAVFLQLFSGFFVAAAAGIWLLPYPHQGLRAVLTYVLPIPPLAIAGAQLTLVVVLMAIQFSLGMVVFGALNGLEPFRAADFPWIGTLACFGLACIAGATLAFWLAAISMRLGAVAAFFVAAFTMSFLQIYATLLRIGSSTYFEQFAETVAKWKSYYRWLPPFGDLIFDIRDTVFKAGTATESIAWLSWGVWLVLGIAAFTLSQKAQLNRRSVA